MSPTNIFAPVSTPADFLRGHAHAVRICELSCAADGSERNATSAVLMAAPLILFGSPSIVSRWRPHPAFCWLVGTLTMILWHVPAVFELALRSHFWHEFEQAGFFIAGILFWWPVVHTPSPAASSGWSVPLYLFFGTLPCDALSAFFGVLWPYCVPALLDRRRAFSAVSSRRPGTRRRPDVGYSDVCLPRPGTRRDNAASIGRTRARRSGGDLLNASPALQIEASTRLSL
jgi:hypothetical protein